MSTKNKPVKLAVLSLLGILGLASCGESTSSEIYAKPSNYDDSIVTITDGEGKEHGKDDIHHDVLSIIYDAMHKGNLASSVLDKALYNFAESVFGVYNTVTKDSRNVITLKKAYYELTQGNGFDIINQFIKEHKSYWLYNDEGKHVDADGHEVTDEDAWVPGERERAKVEARWLAIENRIAEAMYAKAINGSYTEKHLFYEGKFVRALYRDNKKVDYASVKASAPLPQLVPSTLEDDDVFSENVLTRGYYQDSFDDYEDDGTGFEFTYVEDEIIPDVYNDLLIEQYLLDNDIAAIRNTRAREINVIKIAKYSSKESLNADMLVKELLDEIYALPDDSVEHVRYNKEPVYDGNVLVDKGTELFYKELFEKYAGINRGIYSEMSAEQIAVASRINSYRSDVFELKTYDNGTPADDSDDIKYYNHTQYGDLVEEYEKLRSATTWDDLDESLYSTYTSSGTRTVEEGFYQKSLDLIQDDSSIIKDWFIQSKKPSLDVSDIEASGSTINDRLFRLSVANGKIEIGDGNNDELIAENKALLDATDRLIKKDGHWQLNKDDSGAFVDTKDTAERKSNKFICSINGAFFLKKDSQHAGADARNDIVFDDGSNYYIVQILEAEKDGKVRTSTAGNYVETRGQTFLDTVIDEITKVLGSTGNYATVSKNHWLEKMDLKFHDQEVYDYFKTNYPDLFD